MKKYFLLAFSMTLVILLFSPTKLLAQILQDSQNLGKSNLIQSDESNYSGSLWGFGGNKNGILGDGTTINRAEPIQIGNEYNWIAIYCGPMHTFAIKRDGTLWGCGATWFGDGVDPGYYSSFKQIGSERNWKYISTNSRHTLAIKTDGSLWAWGSNGWGSLGDSTLEEGKVYLTPQRIEKTWNDVIFVSAGVSHSAAIREGGNLYMCGFNGAGGLGNGTYNSSFYPIKIGKSNEWSTVSCGIAHTLAIKKNGTLWAWGASNSSGRLGIGTRTDEILAPVQVGGDSNWVSISTCIDHTVALKSNGTLWAWGQNGRYGLGDSTKSIEKTPIQVGKDNDWKSISVRDWNNCATKKDGSLWKWGSYFDKDIYDKAFKVPTKIENISGVTQASCGNSYAMFIRNKVLAIPSVSTLPVKGLNYTTAQSGGNITSDGGDAYVTRGVCYSTSPEPTLKDNITENGRGPGEYPSQLKNLKLFETYYVRAWATNEKGTSYGQEETFKVNLQKPVLISPDSGKVEVPLNTSLTWNKVDSALKYRVQLATNPAFDAPLVDEETINLTYDYDKYENNTVYYWRVQALHDEETSDWSDVWEFTTLQFNPQVLLSPSNVTINVPIDCRLIWKQNSAKTTYVLQVSKFQNFSQKAIDIDLADTVHQSSILEYLTTYYWRVSAVIDEDQSEWSPIWKFTTLMDSVNLKTPMDLSKYIYIPTAMTWQEGIYKKDYRLQISETNDFVTPNTDTLISKTANADVKNLNYWQKYFWRVRNESGDTLGYWSEIWQFKTRMSDILLMYPENTQTGLAQEINFKWYPVVGAEYYQLQISKNDQFTNMVYSKDSITSTEKLVPDLEKDILYYWRVRVWNTESIGTAYWSEVWTFRTGETGVKDEAEVIQIIPNPAGDFITIALKPSEGFEPSEGSAISIYNTLGEKVMSVGAENFLPLQINISALPKGIYFVKVGGETAKFIKL